MLDFRYADLQFLYIACELTAQEEFVLGYFGTLGLQNKFHDLFQVDRINQWQLVSCTVLSAHYKIYTAPFYGVEVVFEL